MEIGCVYTVDTYFEVDKPFSSATEIPFGISMIITMLQKHGHEVELFVITPETNLDETISQFIKNHNPKLFCYTAVSTQYWQVKKVANHIKNLNDDYNYKHGLFGIIKGSGLIEIALEKSTSIFLNKGTSIEFNSQDSKNINNLYINKNAISILLLIQ